MKRILHKRSVKEEVPTQRRVADPEKQHAKEVEQGLRAIYANTEDVGGLKTLTPHRQSWVWVLVIAAGFVFATSGAIIGYSVISQAATVEVPALELQLKGPSDAAFGEEVTYELNWKNPESAPIGSATIHLATPTSFQVVAVDPRPPALESGWLEWGLGALPSHAEGRFLIRGIFTGSGEASGVLQATAITSGAGVSKEIFQTKSIRYNGTIFRGSLDFPSTVVSGDQVRIRYHLENGGIASLTNVFVRMQIPEAFLTDAVASSWIAEEDRWYSRMISTLPSGSSTDVFWTGMVGAGKSLSGEVHAEVGQQREDGKRLVMGSTSRPFQVLSGDLSLRFVVNGGESGRSVDIGERLHGAIAFENTSPESLAQLQLSIQALPLESASGTDVTSLFNWSALEGMTSGTRRSGAALAWTPGSAGWRARLFPQEQGMLEFSIPVTSQVLARMAPGFQWIAQAQFLLASSTRIVRTVPMAFPLRSDVTLDSHVRYTSEEGIPVGRGPLPPVVGQPTEYQVDWKLEKQLHALKSVTVEAKLPANISFSEGATSTLGRVSFDSEARKVRWQIADIPEKQDSVEAFFHITLTPTAADASRFAALLGEVTLEATDVQTGDVIVKRVSAQTTDLPEDDKAKGRGVVRKP